MPLISCPDCNREVSPKAHHCVHCGRPWPGTTRCQIIGAVAAVVLAMGLLFGGVCMLKRTNCKKQRAVETERCQKSEAPKEPAPSVK